MENCDGIASRENKNGLFSMKKSVVILYYNTVQKCFVISNFQKSLLTKLFRLND